MDVFDTIFTIASFLGGFAIMVLLGLSSNPGITWATVPITAFLLPIVIFSIPMSSSNILSSIAKLIRIKSFWKWCKNKEFDLVSIYQRQYSAVVGKGSADQKAVKIVTLRNENAFAIDAMFYNSKKANGSSLIICGVIKLIISSIETPLYVVSVLGILNVMFNGGFDGISFWEITFVPLLVVAIVVSIVSGIAFFIVKQVTKSRAEKMIETIEQCASDDPQ